MYKLIIEGGGPVFSGAIHQGYVGGLFRTWVITEAHAVDPFRAPAEYAIRIELISSRNPDMAYSEVVQRALELWFEELKAGAEKPKEKGHRKKAKEAVEA